MANYRIVQNDNDIAYNVKSIIVNTLQEIDTLPTNWASGSNCLVLEDSSVWFLNVEDETGEKEWKELGAVSTSDYLGTVTTPSSLSNLVKRGNFYRAAAAFDNPYGEPVHVGDIIIAEKDNPEPKIDGVNWTLLHNEMDTDTTYSIITDDTEGSHKILLKPSAGSSVEIVDVVNNLNTDDSTKVLSAAQGKILNDKIDTTEDKINNFKSKGSSTQPIYFDANGNVQPISYTIAKSVPSDAVFTDTWRGVQDNLTSTATNQSLSANQGRILKSAIDGKMAITKSKGSLTQPVYFDANGNVQPISYTIAKSVPSNADFTNTWRGVQNNLTSTSTTDSLSAYQGKLLSDRIAALEANRPLQYYAKAWGDTNILTFNNIVTTSGVQFLVYVSDSNNTSSNKYLGAIGWGVSASSEPALYTFVKDLLVTVESKTANSLSLKVSGGNGYYLGSLTRIGLYQ